jgi:hypothetical protein
MHHILKAARNTFPKHNVLARDIAKLISKAEDFEK